MGQLAAVPAPAPPGLRRIERLDLVAFATGIFDGGVRGGCAGLPGTGAHPVQAGFGGWLNRTGAFDCPKRPSATSSPLSDVERH